MSYGLSKRYYTTSEVAEICGLSQPTIFRAIVHKKIKAATTPGGHFRIAREELEEFLKNNKISFSTAQDFVRVLVVEDNPVELRLFRRALSAEPHFQVQGTESWFSAGLLMRSFKPDVLLLDILLEDFDGREVVKIIRSDPELKSTKIIAITGSKDPKLLREIKSLAIDLLIQKPITPAALRRKIQEVLS